MSSALAAKLSAALASRDERWIRRRLPEPTSASAPPHTDFSSNDYLSLSTSPVLRAHVLKALADSPDILGSGGSRLLVNGTAHAELERRLAAFFAAPAALIFNSGFDANAGFFACIPQPGDVVLYDEFIHASVHDGMRGGRAALTLAYAHNDGGALRRAIERLVHDRPAIQAGKSSVFIAVETVYSMDGTIAPLAEIVALLDELLPAGNGHLVVDEAHATGIYGPQGRGMVALLGLEGKVFARLHTFGKALAASGAVLLVDTVTRDYLLNYARPLIYTTSLSNTNIIAASCSFDMLENGTAEKSAAHLIDISSYFLQLLRYELASIPQSILSLPVHLEHPRSTTPTPSSPTALPTPIIPLLTPYPRPLSAYLLDRGMNARPITWPTVPKGKDRVRVCLHAGTTREEVELLVRTAIAWARELMAEQEALIRKERKRDRSRAISGFLESKL
ncbi:PLP-dependent transferase [Auriscalpium vulgare]|uniref:PLP-dependent transferase n=1 Tax=Auriscalpium vulgare TaxID=40419 RepID=A0ACB8S2A2_9AGAM|nr:PLP-dependent transferase [Auriscalpium vulgare]